eukprot:585182-Hanusia_phi.AAC.1
MKSVLKGLAWRNHFMPIATLLRVDQAVAEVHDAEAEVMSLQRVLEAQRHRGRQLQQAGNEKGAGNQQDGQKAEDALQDLVDVPQRAPPALSELEPHGRVRQQLRRGAAELQCRVVAAGKGGDFSPGRVGCLGRLIPAREQKLLRVIGRELPVGGDRELPAVGCDGRVEGQVERGVGDGH